MLKKRAHWAFHWPKCACMNLAVSGLVNLLVHGTCLDFNNILYLKSPINVNRYIDQGLRGRNG